VLYADGEAVAEIDKDGNVFELHCDHLGSPRHVTDGGRYGLHNDDPGHQSPDGRLAGLRSMRVLQSPAPRLHALMNLFEPSASKSLP